MARDSVRSPRTRRPATARRGASSRRRRTRPARRRRRSAAAADERARDPALGAREQHARTVRGARVAGEVEVEVTREVVADPVAVEEDEQRRDVVDNPAGSPSVPTNARGQRTAPPSVERVREPVERAVVDPVGPEPGDGGDDDQHAGAPLALDQERDCRVPAAGAQLEQVDARRTRGRAEGQHRRRLGTALADRRVAHPAHAPAVGGAASVDVELDRRPSVTGLAAAGRPARGPSGRAARDGAPTSSSAGAIPTLPALSRTTELDEVGAGRERVAVHRARPTSAVPARRECRKRADLARLALVGAQDPELVG